MKLESKTALISGASRSIGKAIALAFAQEGADLIINARESGQELEAVAEECRALGAQVLPVMADISDHEQVNRMVQQGLGKFGKIDILVTCAAVRPKWSIVDISYEEWHRILGVDLHGVFYLCKAIVPGMMERRSGGIIAFGGGATYKANNANMSHHFAAKHGLAGFIKGLSYELGPYGIRVNLLNPGTIDTERRHPEWYPESPGGQAHRDPQKLRTIPLGRPGRVEELASVALFLASDESSFVTGASISCSGGRDT